MGEGAQFVAVFVEPAAKPGPFAQQGFVGEFVDILAFGIGVGRDQAGGGERVQHAPAFARCAGQELSAGTRRRESSTPSPRAVRRKKMRLAMSRSAVGELVVDGVGGTGDGSGRAAGFAVVGDR